MKSENLIESLKCECSRIEEDSTYSYKSHYNASARWSRINLIIGLSSAICGAIAAAIVSIDELPKWIPALLVSLASITTTVLTFLKPSEKSDIHKNAASQYHQLRNQARSLREIDLPNIADVSVARKEVKSLESIRDQLNRSMPIPPTWAYNAAISEISRGAATYKVDQEGL